MALTPGQINTETITPAATGVEETGFLVYVPSGAGPFPMLVVFHAFGNTPASLQTDTSYFAEGQARDWCVVAPLGAYTQNFGAEVPQLNTEAVIDYVLAGVNIDKTKVYGVGFSMGGGWCMSYAARHLDPAHVVFAAVCDHTGGVSVDYVHAAAVDYEAADPLESRKTLENALLYTGPPWAVPEKYRSGSVISIDPVTLAVDPETDMARNLKDTGLILTVATSDPLTDLVYQTTTLKDWLENTVGATVTYLEVAGAVHAWSTVDEDWVCDQLELHTLSTPTSGEFRLLADRDGVWLHFTITQRTAGASTPFTATVTPTGNQVDIEDFDNLSVIKVDTSTTVLNPASALTVRIYPDEALSHEVRLTGYAGSPASVTRNGGAGTWSYDAGNQEVVLTETGSGAWATWVVTP